MVVRETSSPDALLRRETILRGGRAGAVVAFFGNVNGADCAGCVHDEFKN